jgi:guanylate kinase
MKKFNEEISHWNEYNYVVINDELEACYKKILKIMIDEKKGISQKQNFDKIAEKVKELTK